MRDGKPLDELLESVPDEFFNWVRRKRADLLLQYTTIEAEAKAEFQILADRKTTAAYFLTCKHPKILFNMLDNRDYSRTIWMMLRPAFEKPFTEL
jgi:RNA ligase